MARADYIDLKFLKEFKNNKENHIQKIDLRINELIRLKNLLLEDIENINKDIAELESKNK